MKRVAQLRKRSKAGLLWKLFVSTLYISTFTFGGGFVIVSLMKKKFVDELQWLEEDEMLDMAAIAQSSPGAIAVNASILVGYRIAGFAGAATAILGTILPPMVILSLVSVCYQAIRDNEVVAAMLKGMQAGVAAVILDVVLGLSGKVAKEKDALAFLIMGGAFLATWLFGINVILIILVSGLLGMGKTLCFSGRKPKGGGKR